MNLFTRTLSKIFKSSNQQELDNLKSLVIAINNKEKELQSFSESDFREKTANLKKNVQNGSLVIDKVIPESFALVREASKRVLNERHYNVQLMGGMILHEGNIAEATGANVFFKNKKGELHTPVPDSFLDGITRREVIKIAKSKGIKVVERKIKPEEMSEFIGCFLTGTAAEVTPVSQISNFNFKVCDVISDLNDAYQNLVRKDTAA